MKTETYSPVFLVDAYSDPVCLKINGRANYLNCSELNNFFNRLIKKNKTSFTIDFEDCTGMDSTFLGLIAGIALEVKKTTPKGSLCLYNVKERNLELIKNLGLERILDVNLPEYSSQKQKQKKSMTPFDQETNIGPEEILKAHQNLIEADSSNLHKFQDVISFLKKEIDQEKENLSQ